MAIVRKTVIEPGRYLSPDGEVDATPERIAHWVESHRRLRNENIAIPAPWGHQAAAAPVMKGVDTAAFAASRFNAGYVPELLLGAHGEMIAVFDAPGLEADADGNLSSHSQLPDGTPVKTAIKEVSIAIGDWTDGQGRVWPDIVQHIALTPLPVWAGQNGFAQMATSGGKLMCFSTLTRMGAMYDKKDDDVDALAEDLEAAGNLDQPPAESETPLEQMLATEPAGDRDDERVKRLVAMLTANGAPLPPDTDSANFLERLETALGVLLARRDSLPEAPSETAEDAPVVEESPPAGAGAMLMSTIRQEPFLASLVRSEVERRTAGRRKLIAELKHRGLPVDVAAKLGAKTVRLSTVVSASGKIGDDETDRILAILDRVLPEREFASVYLSTVARKGRTKVPSPGDAEEPTERVGTVSVTKKQKADIEARVARIGG